ncbi:YqgE/AlgH family protein [Desulforhopalus sp. 52FAK]
MEQQDQNFTSLAGKFLISTSQMPDPRFAEHVIYICAHSADGAMGVAVNQPNFSIPFAEILQGIQLPIPDSDLPPVHIGGPVDLESAFILYFSSYPTEHKIEVSKTVSLTRETKVLEDIANGIGPDKYLFILGYTGWGPGQLEDELVDRGWLAVPASDEIIFQIDDENKWKAAAMQLGIDISLYEDEIGYA